MQKIQYFILNVCYHISHCKYPLYYLIGYYSRILTRSYVHTYERKYQIMINKSHANRKSVILREHANQTQRSNDGRPHI